MMAYSLIAVSKNGDEKRIPVYSSRYNIDKDKVNIWDIDKITSSYSTREDFMKYLRSEGIIDYTYGYTYIMRIYKEKESKYKNIYNSKLINDCSTNVVDSKIDVSKVPEYQDYFNKVTTLLMKDGNFRKELEKSYIINSSLKEILINYYQESITEHVGCMEEDLITKYRYEMTTTLREYKSFRQMYVFVEEYLKPPKTYIKPKKNEPEKKKYSTTIQSNIPYEIKFNYADLADLNHGDREYEEFLDEEEYEDAYGKGGRHK